MRNRYVMLEYPITIVITNNYIHYATRYPLKLKFEALTAKKSDDRKKINRHHCKINTFIALLRI